MARQSGYVVTIKAFVPVSKTDFSQQAEAAAQMAALTKDKRLPDGFADLAKITDISAKFGSADVGE